MNEFFTRVLNQFHSRCKSEVSFSVAVAPTLALTPFTSSMDKRKCLRSNKALSCWRSIEKSTVTDLSRRKLYQAPLFSDIARAFLSVQSSSAFPERLFSDAGNYEGSLRQHAESSFEELLLMIRSYVQEHVRTSPRQQSFLSGLAQAVRDLAEEIATERGRRTVQTK